MATVVAEHEFIKVDLQVLAADRAMSTSQPGLKIADSTMDARHDQLGITGVLGCSLETGTVVIAGLG